MSNVYVQLSGSGKGGQGHQVLDGLEQTVQARALGQPLTREVSTNGRSSELTESIRFKLRNDLATVRTRNQWLLLAGYLGFLKAIHSALIWLLKSTSDFFGNMENLKLICPKIQKAEDFKFLSQQREKQKTIYHSQRYHSHVPSKRRLWELDRMNSPHPMQWARVKCEITHGIRWSLMQSPFLWVKTVEYWQFHMVQPSILKGLKKPSL